jgi:thioredoxin 1
MANMREIDEQGFEAEVVQSPLPVLVYFQSEWCVTCKAVSPFIDALSGSFGEKMKFVKVDTVKSPKVAADNTVLSTPTVVFFKNGLEMKRNVGFIAEKNLKILIEQTI